MNEHIEPLFLAIVTLIASVGASSGFWAYLQKRDSNKSATTRLLLGLAHDRIIFLGMRYIEQGWVSKDEYEDFVKYLYNPYLEFGGNGLAEKVYKEVTKLPIRTIEVNDAKSGRRTSRFRRNFKRVV